MLWNYVKEELIRLPRKLRLVQRVPPSVADRYGSYRLVAAGVGIALIAVWLAVPATRPVVSTAIWLAAFGAILAGIHAHRPPRRGDWLIFAAGFGITLLANPFKSLPEALLPIPAPVLGAIFGTTGSALQVIGLMRLLRRHATSDRWRAIDSAVVIAATLFLSWFVIIAPALERGLRSQMPVGMLLGYVVVVVVFLELALRLVVSGGHRQPAFWLFLAGMVSALASQVALMYLDAQNAYVPWGIADLGWQTGAIFWGLAALHPSMRRIADSPPAGRLQMSWIRLVVICAAALVPNAILIANAVGANPSQRGDIAHVGIGSAIVFTLVTFRLAGALRELGRSMQDRERLEHELRDQALHDALTGLPNRTLFIQEVEAALRADPHGVAVLYCDVDDFKSVNDTLGHGAGDELLVAVARRLRGSLRASDLAARLGGDEFGILLRDLPEPAAALATTERILATFNDPFELSGHRNYVGTSVGVALGSGKTDVSDILRNADVAMYLAKRQGKGRYEIYRPSLDAEVMDRVSLRASLEEAIRGGELEVHYQPIVELSTERPIALEALVRWNHKERGLILPAEFLPVAQATGLIVPLGRWVLNEACRQMADWTRRGVTSGVSLAVNLSPAQVRHPSILDDIRDALESSGLPPHLLTLEVTEGVIADVRQATHILEEIRSIGVRIAIDDFGSGSSALSSLGTFPVDHLKIDRSFVEVIGRSARQTALTETVLRIAASLQLGTAAEGIDSREQAQALRALGCVLGQGLLFGAPGTAVTTEAYLARRPRRPSKASAHRNARRSRAVAPAS
jgi:diguanylate cyclase (GGDEF)-like protein